MTTVVKYSPGFDCKAPLAMVVLETCVPQARLGAGRGALQTATMAWPASPGTVQSKVTGLYCIALASMAPCSASLTVSCLTEGVSEPLMCSPAQRQRRRVGASSIEKHVGEPSTTRSPPVTHLHALHRRMGTGWRVG